MIDIVLVTSPACHFCEQAKDVLTRVADEYPIRWREIDIMSEEGAAAVRRHQVPFAPALFVDNRFHGHGRVSERKLRKALDLAMKEHTISP